MSLQLMDAVMKAGPSRMPQRLVLLTLAKLARPDGSVQVAVRDLMRMTGGEFVAVSRLLNELRQEGWFNREATDEGPPRYWISFHRLGLERPDPAAMWKPKQRLCVRCSAPLAQQEGRA